MPLDEKYIGVSEELAVQLVDCTPIDNTPIKLIIPIAVDFSPVQKALQATIEQTGADPPPYGVMNEMISPYSIFTLERSNG